MKAEKERVRRMIVKVKRVLAKPREERQQLIGPKWLALLDTISTEPVSMWEQLGDADPLNFGHATPDDASKHY